MAGLFGGYDIPDWLLFGQQSEQQRPNAMLGGEPAFSFGDRWSPVPQAIQGGQFDPQGSNFLQGGYGARPGYPNSAPLPPPPAFPGANQFAGQGQAMGYAPEEPRPQQPLAGGPPGPQYAQAGPPGFGDRLNAGAMGFFNARSPMEAVGNLMGGAVTGRRQDDRGREQEAMQAAIGAVAGDDSIDPMMKRALIQSPQLAMDFIQSKIKKLGGTTQDIMEYEYARKQGFRGTLEQFMKTVKQREVENFALTPTYVTDPKTGELSIVQLGNRGNVSVPTIPGGGQVATKNLIKVPNGDNWDFVDPVTKQVVKTVPRNAAELEAEEARGKIVGPIRANMPKIENAATELLSRITAVENHPGMKVAVGQYAGRFKTELVPGDMGKNAADFKERMGEIGGKVWTEAIKQMVNLGALSDAEGRRITESASRLQITKDEKDLRIALNDIRNTVRKGLEASQAIVNGRPNPRAGQPAAAPPTDPLGLRR